MNKFNFTFNALIACAFFLVFTSIAQAQVPRTFVSVDGKDNNPCDVPDKPCRHIQAAITKVQAGGEVIVISSGSYEPFIINKSVTVAAAPGEHVGITVTDPDNGVSINAGATDAVVLRGLTFNGLGGVRGILFGNGAALHIENCVINGFSNNGIQFNGSGNNQLFVKDTIVRNGSGGITVFANSGTTKALIEHSRLENNELFGLFVGRNSHVTVRDSVAAGNGIGFWANTGIASTTAEINVENCVVTGNTTGIVSGGAPSSSATIRVSNTTVTNNDTGLSPVSGSYFLLSRLNNTVEGNTNNGVFTGTFAPK